MINQYRKKPIIVSAVQWDGSTKSGDEIISWARGKVYFNSSNKDYLYVATLEGEMKVFSGDFVICGISGEFYPCKPDIFEMTHEEVCEEEYLSPEKIKCAPTCDQCKHKSSCHYGLPALPEKKKCGCEAGPCKECSKEFNYPLGPAFDGSTLSTNHRPYVCPVCSGAGIVSRPPHIPGDQTTWSGTGTPMYTCHACQGTGVVWG